MSSSRRCPAMAFPASRATPAGDPERIARAWTTLMNRLGYRQFVASGGDWGALITDLSWRCRHHPELLAHPHQHGRQRSRPKSTRRPMAVRRAGGPRRPRSSMRSTTSHSSSSMASATRNEMGNRPQTLYATRGFAGRRSPPGSSTTTSGQLPADRARVRRRARGADAGRHPRQHHSLLADEDSRFVGPALLGEQVASSLQNQGVTIPVVISAFPTELYQVPESWAESGLSRG